MIIKKFQAETETEAVLKAKEEMGSGAVVLNIKTIKHRGISRLFKKDIVEVTAALEEVQNTGNIPVKSINVAVGSDTYGAQGSYNAQGNYNTQGLSNTQTVPGADIIPDNPPVIPQNMETASMIEERLNSLQSMLENRMKSSARAESAADEGEADEEKDVGESTNMKFLKLIYNQLLDNEVDEKYANKIIDEIQSSIKKEATVDSILAAIYQKIVLKAGQPNTIKLEGSKRKIVFFVGPTGVGKTTTIAKLASYYKLQKKARVAFITTDTFRIAAVEQLRVYAGILDVPMQVIYTIEEMNQAIEAYKEYDLILVDTAGRSHRNSERCNEVIHLINDVRLGEDMEKLVYLVMSASTKYRDLIKIDEVFNEIKDYNIIFTKLDETSSLGNILNMKLKTGVSIAYVTSGQVVPDDISVFDPQKMARSLLGSSE